MLRHPKLHAAYEELAGLPATALNDHHLYPRLSALTRTTMLLLKLLDDLGRRHDETLVDLRELLSDNARLIQQALDEIRRK